MPGPWGVPSVVSRPISGHGGVSHAHASQEDAALSCTRRSSGSGKPGISLDQVAERLRYEHPGQQARWLSQEVIYTWIYALPKGELARHGGLLRSGWT
jgi:IS30 family transposase